MSVPVPRDGILWCIMALMLMLLAACIVVGSLNVEAQADVRDVSRAWDDICKIDRNGIEDARRVYADLAARQKARCDERMKQWKKERETLEAIVKKAPCCEGGCSEELVYKDYLLQAQATYYKKHMKKVCGVRRPPDPDDDELKSFMAQIEDEEEDVF